MELTRRGFLRKAIAGSAGLCCFSALPGCQSGKFDQQSFRRPNILLMMTDDQGYGDLSLHGNPHLQTPGIDNFAKESVEFTNFYVSPVCAPTRASLMTGRYHMRTGVVDTYIGRAMMHSDEITIAEKLKEHGYATGIFGKWHLGDNYPLRPQDQGFDEVVIHNGGGIGQPSDPLGGSSYFDPILQHNGKQQQYKGYCMDVYADLTIDFIKANKRGPFFAYLATNTPHSPLQVPDKYLAKYKSLRLKDKTARVYGMVENIDENFKRLLTVIEQLGIADNTIVVFMTDNGPCPSSIEADRHMAGLRGRKATVYENGIKVPFFIRWPNGFEGKRKIAWASAHIDVLPTLLDACGAGTLADMDGVSLMPLLQGDMEKLADRNLYFQSHRGDVPELFRAFAVRGGRYKLVQSAGWDPVPESEYKFELFDIENDPCEENDISALHPQIVEEMKARYVKWFEDVSSTRGYQPPYIIIGTEHENPTTLTRQDWRDAKGWNDTDVGHWKTEAAQSGNYKMILTFSNPMESDSTAKLKVNDAILAGAINKGEDQIAFDHIKISRGYTQIKGWVESGYQVYGVKYIEVSR